MWGRAALAHRAQHGCESPTAPALLSIPGKFGFGGCSSPFVAFSFCLLCWKPLWCCTLVGELGMSPQEWATGAVSWFRANLAGGCTWGICSPGVKNDLGMKRKRPEGSGCTLGCRAGLWGVLGVHCWLMGCSQGTRGQQDPAAATTVGCSGNSRASPWEPAGGEPQTLLEGAGGIAASCLGWASHPQVCAAAAEASPVAHGHWECSELHQPHNFLGPGLDPEVAPHALGQS